MAEKKASKADVPAQIGAESKGTTYIPADAEILDASTIRTTKGARYTLSSEQVDWMKSLGSFGLETSNAMKLFGVEPVKRKNGSWRFNKRKALDTIKAAKLSFELRMAEKGGKVVFVVKK